MRRKGHEARGTGTCKEPCGKSSGIPPAHRALGLRGPGLAGIATPLGAIESWLLAGKITDAVMEIEKRSGCRINTIQEVKNDWGRAAARS